MEKRIALPSFKDIVCYCILIYIYIAAETDVIGFFFKPVSLQSLCTFCFGFFSPQILKELKPLAWIFVIQNLPEVAYLAYLLYAVSLAKLRFADFGRIRGKFFLGVPNAALGVKDGRNLFTPFPEMESEARRNEKMQIPRAYHFL